MRLIILGAGGYGKTVADIARQSGKYEQIYFLDDGQEKSDLILGTCAEFLKFADGNTEMYPAFGNNEMRLDWMEKLSDAQIVLPRLIHATAYVSPTAEVEASCIAACDHKHRLSDPIGLYYQLWFDCRPWMCDRRRRTYFSGDCDQGRKSDSKSNKN